MQFVNSFERISKMLDIMRNSQLHNIKTNIECVINVKTVCKMTINKFHDSNSRGLSEHYFEMTLQHISALNLLAL